jgi:hypothetical protein
MPLIKSRNNLFKKLIATRRPLIRLKNNLFKNGGDGKAGEVEEYQKTHRNGSGSSQKVDDGRERN